MMKYSIRFIGAAVLLSVIFSFNPVDVSAQSPLSQLYSLLDQLNQQRQRLEKIIASLGDVVNTAQAASSLITSSADCPSTTPPLTQGAGGVNGSSYVVSQVVRIQRYLISAGYLASGNDTGYYGTLTTAAITRFQGKHQLGASGVADRNTLAAMRKECLAFVSNQTSSVSNSSTAPMSPATTTATTTRNNTSTTNSMPTSQTSNTDITITPVPTTGVVPVNETSVWAQEGPLLSGYSLEQPMIMYDSADTAYPYKLWMYGWVSSICNQNLHISAHACDAIFYAVSSDGKSWRVYTGDVNGVPQFASGSPETWKPVIHAGVGPYDDTHAGDPKVIKIGGTYFMVYSMAGADLDGKWPSETGDTDGFAEAIAGAISTDGIHWTLRSTPLLEYPGSLGKPDPVVGGGFARPSLMYENGKFKLWYDYTGSTGTLDTGYAELTGLADVSTFMNGTFSILKGGSNPVMKNWPNPSVIKIGTQYFMFGDPIILMPTGSTKEEQSWTSRTIAEAVSSDGLNWTLRGYIDPPSGCGSILMPESYVLGDRLYLSFSCQKGGSPYDPNFYQIRRVYRPLNATLPVPSAPNLSLLANGFSGTVSINSGQNVNITWSASNAVACTLVEETDTGSRTTTTVNTFNGLWVRTPLQSVTYRMSCVSIGYTTTSSSNYVTSKEVRVQVSSAQTLPPPPTVSLTTSASSIVAGQSVTVSWSSQNANVCSLLETVSGQQTSGLSGIWTRTPTASTNYNLQCYNNVWSGSGDTTNIATQVRTVTVTTAPSTPVPSCSSAGPDNVTLSSNAAGHTVLVYGVQNAQAVALGVWSDAGGQNHEQDDIRWYYATNQGDGTWSATFNPQNHPVSSTDRLIKVAAFLNPGATPTLCDYANFSMATPVASNPAPTATLTVNGQTDPVTITAGDTVQVAWASQNALSCIVLETSTNTTQTTLSGSWTRTPSQTTNYAISCINGAYTGSGDTQNIVQKSVLVTVNPAPVAQCSATPDYITIAPGSTSFTATVNNAGNAQTVAAGVWSQAGGQDDIRWYYGTNQGNGTWSIMVDPRNHPTTAVDQVVYIAPWLNIGSNQSFCDYASYLKAPN